MHGHTNVKKVTTFVFMCEYLFDSWKGIFSLKFFEPALEHV
jgi:hypothetical protein